MRPAASFAPARVDVEPQSEPTLFLSAFPDAEFLPGNAEESTQKSPQWAERKEIAEGAKSPRMSGEPGRTRTSNPLIKSDSSPLLRTFLILSDLLSKAPDSRRLSGSRSLRRVALS